jgi:hypothetical protein
MKTINVNAYSMVKKNESNSIYDILMCETCNKTCMRCNFSRHKLSPKHIKLMEFKDLGKVIEETHNENPFVNRKSVSSVVCDKVVELLDSKIEDKIAHQVEYYEVYLHQ